MQIATVQLKKEYNTVLSVRMGLLVSFSHFIQLRKNLVNRQGKVNCIAKNVRSFVVFDFNECKKKTKNRQTNLPWQIRYCSPCLGQQLLIK